MILLVLLIGLVC